MSDEAAFLAAIIANPDDDLPRLVFADWLDENGDPDRAEFIRWQIEHHRLGDKASRVLSTHPIYILYAKNKEKWLAGFPKGLNLNIPHGQFQRGFFSVLRVSAAKFDRIPKRVWARYPIQELHLSEVRGRLGRVFAKPEMNRIRELGFHVTTRGGLSADDISSLASTQNLTGLRKLTVNARNGNPLATALARCPSLGGLESLHLSDNAIDTEGVATLTRTGTANLLNLKRLWLGLSNMNERMIGEFAACPALARLENLSLYGGGRIGDDGAIALARSPHLANLRHMWLHDQTIGDRGATALGSSPHLTTLRNVRINGSALGPEGVRAIANGAWTVVEELELDRCSIGNEEAAALAERGVLTALTELNLSDNDIGPAGAVALSRAKWLRRLTSLDLENNPIGDEGALALCRSKALTNLKSLRVGSTFGSNFSLAVLKALKARFGKDVVS